MEQFLNQVAKMNSIHSLGFSLLEEALEKMKSNVSHWTRISSEIARSIECRLPPISFLDSFNLEEEKEFMSILKEVATAMQNHETITKETLKDLIKRFDKSLTVEKYRVSDYHRERFMNFYDFPNFTHYPKQTLELNDIQNITDIDALKVIRMFGCLSTQPHGFVTEYSPIEKIKSAVCTVTYYPQHIADFLREQKYAIPYGIVQVEDLIKMGWLKIKN